MSATDVSTKLGEYMLKGWVLTDNICAEEGCSVPLMRSPSGRVPAVFFCARCDGGPNLERAVPLASSSISPAAREPSPSTVQTSSSHLSRSSTPPTDLSSALSSPTFATPIDTQEALHRRQQSDAASAEIGKRLLKGWAMLADECPNMGCYGVPLVRPPQAGGGKDPRKECVACGTIYISERDAHGWERLVATDSRELLDARDDRQGLHRDEIDSSVQPNSHPPKPSPKDPWDKGNATVVSMSHVPHQVDTASSRSARNSAPHEFSAAEGMPTTRLKPGMKTVLEDAAASLELALQSLSQRLTAVSSITTFVDPASLGQTADAMGKVMQALVQVEQLRRETIRRPA